MPEPGVVRVENDAKKDAGCFAVMVACVGGMFAKIGRCLGRSWCAISPVGRIFTQTAFTVGLICSCVACIPALQDLFWGWILMLFACVAAVCGLYYGWEEKLCGPKMPDLDKMTPGKPASKLGLMLLGPTYWLSMICWAGIVGMSAYVLYLYILPISRGFTTAEGLAAVPPNYCDKVTGQSSKWTVPTTDSAYCDSVQSEWQRGAASTGIGIGIMFACVMLGSCLKTGNAEVLALMVAKKLRMEEELDRKKINMMEQQVQSQQAQIVAQQAEITQLKTAPAPAAATSVAPPVAAAAVAAPPPPGAYPAPAPASIGPPATISAPVAPPPVGPPPVTMAPPSGNAPPAPPRMDQI